MKPPVKRLKAVRGLVDHVSQEVASLQAGPLRALLPVLREAERTLSADLEKVLGMMDGSEYKAQMLRRALVQVRGSLNAIERVRPEMVGELNKAGRRAGQMANRHIMEELAAFSARFGGTVSPIPIIPASKVLDKSLLDRYATSAARWSKRVRDDIKRQLAVGMVRGENVSEMTKRITGITMPDVHPAEAAEQIGSELMRRYTSQAHRIVRTEVINAYNEHAQDGIRAAAEDDERIQKRWDATLDKNTCDDCAHLDGQTVDPHEDFPGGVDAPPLHPYCRCAVIAWREDWGDAKNKDIASVQLSGRPAQEELE